MKEFIIPSFLNVPMMGPEIYLILLARGKDHDVKWQKKKKNLVRGSISVVEILNVLIKSNESFLQNLSKI